MKKLMTQKMVKDYRDLGFKCEETEKEIILKTDSGMSYLVEYIIFDKDIREGCEVDYDWYFLDTNTQEKSNISIATSQLINLVNDTTEKLYSRCEKLGAFILTPLEALKQITTFIPVDLLELWEDKINIIQSAITKGNAMNKEES
jgi:hypothetical protein